MPVKLAEAAGLESDKRRGNGLGDGEVGRVDLVELAAVTTDLLRLVLQGLVDVGALLVGVGIRHVSHVAVAHGAIDNVRVGRREVLKHGLVNAKVAGNDVLGRVSQPVVDVESGSNLLAGCPTKSLSVRGLTQSCQSHHRQRQGGTRSRHRGPGQCGQLPWESTRYHRSSARWPRRCRSHRRQIQ